MKSGKAAFQRLRRYRVALAAGLALLLGAAVTGLVVLAWTPSYAFPLDETDPASVREVVGLAREFHRIDEAMTQRYDPTPARAVLAWMRLPHNAAAARWVDLARAAPDGADPAQTQRFAIANDYLLRLENDPAAPRPADLRAIDERERTRTEGDPLAAEKVVLAWQAAGALAARDRAQLSAARRPASAALIDRLGWSAWPVAGRSPWREAARRWLGRPTLSDVWATALVSNSTQAETLAAWFDRLARLSEVPFGPTLVLRPTRSSSVPVIQHAGLRSRIDVEVWRRGPAADAPDQTAYADTGVRFCGVLPRAAGAEAAEIEATLDDRTVTMVDVETFNRFLHGLGLPQAVAASELEPTRTSAAGVETVQLGVRLRHAQFSALSWPVALTLDSAGAADPVALVATWRDEALTRLIDHLAQVDRVHDWRVRFAARDQGDLPSAPATLEVPRVGPVSLRVRATGAGHLSFADATTLEERTRLGQALADRNETLRPLAAWVVPEALTFHAEVAPGVLRGRLAVRVSGSLPGATDLRGVTWAIHPDGRVEVVIPPQTPPALLARWSKQLAPEPTPAPASMTSTPAAPVKPPRTASELIAEIRAALGEFCDPALRDRIEVAPPVENQGKSLVSLGLKLADWPGLTLGPRAVGPDEPAGPAVRALLAEPEVVRRAGEVWAAGGDHPRYGPATSQLTAFSAERGTARVESTLPIWNNLKLTWPQILSAAQGVDWGSLGERAVQEGLDRAGVRGMIRQASADLANAAFGLDFEASLDENRFGRGRWLRFNPPAIGLTARVQPISWLPFKAAVEHVTLGAPNGLNFDHADAEVRHHGTLFLPGVPFSLSDVGVGVNGKDHTLKVKVKVAPPTLHLLPGAGGGGGGEANPDGLLVQGQEGTASAPGAADRLAAMGVDVGHLPPMLRQKLRLDNLWLNIAHLDIGLGLGIDKLDLRGDGSLNLIGSRAANANSRLDVQERSFEGTMATDAAAAPYLPRMDGKVAINRGGSGGFVANGRINLAAVEAGVQVDYPTSDEPGEKRLHLRGRTTLPGFGTFQVHGHSDLQFQKPVLESIGKVTIDDPKLGKVEASVHLDDHGYELTTSWFTPVGVKLSRTFRGTTFDETESQRVRSELAQAIEQSRATAQPVRPADPAEVAAVEPISVTPPVVAWKLPESEPRKIGLTGDESGPHVFANAGLPSVPSSELEKALENGRVKIQRKGKLIVDLPVAALGLERVRSSDQLRQYIPMTYWEPARGPAALLVVDTFDRDAALYRLDRPDALAGPLEPPGPEFAPLGPIVPRTNDDQTLPRLTLNKQVLVSAISARLVGNVVQRIEKVEAGALLVIQTPPPAGGGTPETFGIAVRLTDLGGINPRLAFLYDWLTPPSTWAEFAARFPKLAAPEGDVGVLAYRPGEGTKLNVSWLRNAPQPPADSVLSRDDGATFFDVFPAAEDPGSVPLRLEVMRGPDPRSRFLALRRLIEVSWAGGLAAPAGVSAAGGETTVRLGFEVNGDKVDLRDLGAESPLAGGHAIDGPSGLAIVPAEKPGRVAGLWLAPRLARLDGPASGPGAARFAFWMSRTAFLAWNDAETAPLLPRSLSAEAGRGEVALLTLALQAVRAWDRNRETWGADPMTLLARLGSPELRTPRETVQP